MGDDIGSSSVTDCRLRLDSEVRQHIQQCRAAPWQKSKQTQPEPMSSPINYPAYVKHKLFFDSSTGHFFQSMWVESY